MKNSYEAERSLGVATMRSRLSVLTVAFILSAFSASPVLGQATLENPAPESFQSGISVISGWACEAQRIEITFNDGPPQEAAYGTSRGDTQATCGDTDNGFGLLFNWNLLGDGIHTVSALADGVEFASVTVIVTTLGKEFLRGASRTFPLADFPDAGASRTLRWQQSQQNFVLTDGSPGRGGGTSGAPPHVLENPVPGSFQSGIGLISGWVCDAQTITIRFDDGPPQEAAYGTSRGDTQGACGDTDNGFGLPFNWNLLDDGLHTVVASADGVEFARVEVTVTTLGTEFRRGLSREVVISDFPEAGTDVVLQWQEAQQNFVITTALPTQQQVAVTPVVTLPAGVQIPNVTVRSFYAETAEVLASPKPSLLLAEDAGGTVLLGVANRDGGLLGERVGSVAVSVDSTAVVLVSLAAGYPVHTIDQSMVDAIQAHPSYQDLIAAMSTQIATDKNFLDRLPDHTDIIVSIQEVATAIASSPQRVATHSLSAQGMTPASLAASVGNVVVQGQEAGADMEDEVAEQKRRLAVSLFAASVADLFLPTAPLQRVLQILMMQPTYDPAYTACVAVRVRERTAEGGPRSLSPRELSELAAGESLPPAQLARGLAGALQDAEAALECLRPQSHPISAALGLTLQQAAMEEEMKEDSWKRFKDLWNSDEGAVLREWVTTGVGAAITAIGIKTVNPLLTIGGLIIYSKARYAEEQAKALGIEFDQATSGCEACLNKGPDWFYVMCLRGDTGRTFACVKGQEGVDALTTGYEGRAAECWVGTKILNQEWAGGDTRSYCERVLR